MSARSLKLALVAVVMCLALFSQTQVHAASASTAPATTVVDSGQLQVLLELADAWPALKTRSTGFWTASNLENACASNHPIYGISACDSNGFISELSFGDASTVGQLPDTLANLTKLTTLIFSAGVTGTLPASFSALTSLSQLQVTGSCALTGTIPSSWRAMTSLGVAILTYATDVEPTAWNPDALPNSIYTFVLTNYNFGADKSLPSEFFTGFFLTLRLENIIYDGSAPIALLSNSRLSTVVLTANPVNLASQSSSYIPGDWSSMSGLTSITVANLPWEGSLPAFIPANLQILSMTNMPLFVGSITQAMVDSTTLQTLALSGLPGVNGVIPAPTTPANSALIRLQLNALAVTGQFNSSFLDAPHLIDFRLSNLVHLAAQSLPAGSGACKLTIYNVSNSGFTGTIPAYVASTCTIQTLDLSANSLEGVLPETWSNDLFTAANISHNSFTGTVPASFAKKSVNYGLIDVSFNQFSGFLPKDFFQYISTFIINDNNFDVCANSSLASSIMAPKACQIYPQAESICECADAAWYSRCAYASLCPTPTAGPVAPTATPTAAPIAPTASTPTPVYVPVHIPTGAASIASFSNVLLMASIAALLALAGF